MIFFTAASRRQAATLSRNTIFRHECRFALFTGQHAFIAATGMSTLLLIYGRCWSIQHRVRAEFRRATAASDSEPVSPISARFICRRVGRARQRRFTGARNTAHFGRAHSLSDMPPRLDAGTHFWKAGLLWLRYEGPISLPHWKILKDAPFHHINTPARFTPQRCAR